MRFAFLLTVLIICILSSTNYDCLINDLGKPGCDVKVSTDSISDL